jgi:hypothetical protein
VKTEINGSDENVISPPLPTQKKLGTENMQRKR